MRCPKTQLSVCSGYVVPSQTVGGADSAAGFGHRPGHGLATYCACASA